MKAQLSKKLLHFNAYRIAPKQALQLKGGNDPIAIEDLIEV